MNKINETLKLEKAALYKPIDLNNHYKLNFSTSGIVLEKAQSGNVYTANFTLPGSDQSANQKDDLYKTTLKYTLAADKSISENEKLLSSISKIVKYTMRLWGMTPNDDGSIPKLNYRVRDLSYGTAMEITPGYGGYNVRVSPLMGKASTQKEKLWAQFLYKVTHERFHAEYDKQGFPISEHNLNVEKTIDNMAADLLGMPWLKNTSYYLTGKYYSWIQD